MKQRSLLVHQVTFSIIALVCSLSACTKTVINAYPAPSKSRIENFTIVNAITPIAGVVDDNDHTITVYIPPTQFLSILQPAITLAEGATVSPASGAFIDNLADYFAQQKTITYTVTGSDKTVTTYTLKIISQQPPLSFNEVTTDTANPVTYNHSLSSYTNIIVIYTSTPYPFSPSATEMAAAGRVSLVSASGREHPLISNGEGAPFFAGSSSVTYSYVSVPLGSVVGYNKATSGADQMSPPPGLYWIKIQYYSQITTLKNPIKIIYE